MSNQNGGIDDRFKKDVEDLLKTPLHDHAKIYKKLEELKSKYNNDVKIVDAIFEAYKERMKKIQSLSKKIKEKLMKKYPYASNMELINKISGYKSKYEFGDYEEKMIIEMVLYDKHTPLHNNEYPYTPLSKALGYVPQNYSYSTGTMTVEGPQVESLNAILTINRDFKDLHAQVTLQSLTYEAMSVNAIVGTVDSSRINIYSHIHPVIVALFLPKIRILEERMLLTSIAKVIAARKEGTPLQMQPEVELYNDICCDPVSNQCTENTIEPFTDLLNRCNVQSMLWNSILHLRQGKYYIEGLSSLLTTLDRCKNNDYDAPEFTYVKDIGTIIQKLFGCFSLRPIYVAIENAPISINGGIIGNANALTSFSAVVPTAVPMIVVRIPNNNAVNTVTQQINLVDSLKSVQTYQTGHTLEKKIQRVIACREILVFYVPRRNLESQTFKYNQQYTITALPVSTTALEKLNDTDVACPHNISIGNDLFNLRSIVIVESKTSALLNNEHLIVGCGAIIIPTENKDDNGISKLMDNTDCSAVLYYSPLGLFEKDSQHENGKIRPIGLIPYKRQFKDSMCALQLASTNGTVYIYHAERKEKMDSFGLLS